MPTLREVEQVSVLCFLNRCLCLHLARSRRRRRVRLAATAIWFDAMNADGWSKHENYSGQRRCNRQGTGGGRRWGMGSALEDIVPSANEGTEINIRDSTENRRLFGPLQPVLCAGETAFDLWDMTTSY